MEIVTKFGLYKEVSIIMGTIILFLLVYVIDRIGEGLRLRKLAKDLKESLKQNERLQKEIDKRKE